MTEKFRACVLVEPGKIEIQNFDIPEVAEDSALLKVESCGICGTDKHILLGHSPTAPFPFVAGHEFIGTIVKLGKKASEVMAVFGGPPQEGDRVAIAPASMPCGRCDFCLNMPQRPSFCPNRFVYGLTSTKKHPPMFGGYSEYVCLYPRTYVFKLPKNMSMKRAVLMEPVATALRAVERAYSPGEAFMSHGSEPAAMPWFWAWGPIGAMVVACPPVHRGRNDHRSRLTPQSARYGQTDGCRRLDRRNQAAGKTPGRDPKVYRWTRTGCRHRGGRSSAGFPRISGIRAPAAGN